jgi:hypothetical protein
MIMLRRRRSEGRDVTDLLAFLAGVGVRRTRKAMNIGGLLAYIPMMWAGCIAGRQAIAEWKRRTKEIYNQRISV